VALYLCAIAASAARANAPTATAPQWTFAGALSAARDVSALPKVARAAVPAVAPVAIPPVAAPSQPVDLNPRPLGVSRESKPLATARADQPSAGSTLWNNQAIRTSGSLLIVLGLIFLLAAVAKRLGRKGATLAAALGPGGRAPEGLLEVLGRYPISRGQTIILLKVDSRVLLLAQTMPRIRGGVGTLTTLCEITQPEEVASILVKAGEHSGQSSGARFQHLLHAFDRKHAPEALPDHTELDLRRVQHTDDGDRVETWDDQAKAPVVHRFPTVEPLPGRGQGQVVRTAVGGPLHEPMPVAQSAPPSDSFGSLRQRLHALKGEAHR